MPCRFVCRDRIGESATSSAAFLPAIPAHAVVYGAGESSIILSKARAPAVEALESSQEHSSALQAFRLWLYELPEIDSTIVSE